MKIFRNSIEIHDIEIDKNTELRQSISGEDLITSQFTLPQKIDLQIGDYVIWNEVEYTILDEPQIKKAQSYFTYNLQFKSDLYKLKNIMVLLDGNNEFYVFGNAQTLVSVIINNLNRVYGGYYADFAEDTPEINFYFNNHNCLSAMQNIATELECEFRIEGKKITFKKKIGQETGLVFRYKKELREIERQVVQNSELVTRLYPYGSTRNITTEYGSKRLRVPAIENNVGVFGTIERSAVFEEIYPRFKGVVSSTQSNTVYTDTGIDFNINDQLMPGMTAKVTFNTGDLAGRSFEIANYNNTSKKIEIISFADDTGLVLPNDTLKPRIGDKYVFWDIKMPQTYIDNAEIELHNKAQEYLDKYSQPNVVYRITPNYPELRRSQIILNTGDLITVEDQDFNINFEVRILSLTQKLANQYEYSITIGNQITLNYVTQVINDTKKIRNEIYLNQITQSELYNRLFYNLRNLKTAVYVNRGEFDANEYYYNNQHRRDYVYRYDSEGVKNWYYFIGEDHTKSAWIESEWQLIGDSFEILATETILSENANIGDWIIQNGQIVSQNGYDNEPRAQLNGKDGILKLVSPVSVYTEGWGSKEYKQELELNSLIGKLKAYRNGDSQQLAATAYLSADGVFANSPGTDALPASTGIEAKGALVGLGYGKMTKRYSGDFIAGVIGRASNSASNPAPAYGGAFWGLKSFGRYVGAKSITSNYTVGLYDERIYCFNTKSISVKLMSNPHEGMLVHVKRINSDVRVYGNGNEILFKGIETDIGLERRDQLEFVFHGGRWIASFYEKY